MAGRVGKEIDEKMKPFEHNPRKLTKKKAHRLEDTLARLGDLSGVVHELNTGRVAGGHQRLRVMFGEDAGEFRVKDGDIEYVTRFEKPDSQGTVAQGFILWRGYRYAYRETRWNDEDFKEANIAANVGAGTWDWEELANAFDAPDLMEWGFSQETLADWKRDVGALENLLGSEEDKQEDEQYSRKIEAPIYTPKGDKPAINDLYDNARTLELLDEIEKADLPEDEKEFLRIAARRHTVLNFKRIAEYYAHSDKATQLLMENSALVIIDFNRAIELGYVKLSEEIAAQYLKDYPDAR